MSRHIFLCDLLLLSRLDAKRDHTMSITMKFDPAMIPYLQAPQFFPLLIRNDGNIAENLVHTLLGNSQNDSAVFDNNVGGNKNIMDYSEPVRNEKVSFIDQVAEVNQEFFLQRNFELDPSIEIPDSTAGTVRFKGNPGEKLEEEEQECPHSSSTTFKTWHYFLAISGVLMACLTFRLVQQKFRVQLPVELCAKSDPLQEIPIHYGSTLNLCQIVTSDLLKHDMEVRPSMKMTYSDLEKKEELLSSRIWDLECEMLKINIEYASSTSLQISNQSFVDLLKIQLQDDAIQIENISRERDQALADLSTIISQYDEKAKSDQQTLLSLKSERNSLKIRLQVLAASMKLELSKVNHLEKRLATLKVQTDDQFEICYKSIAEITMDRDDLIQAKKVSDRILLDLNKNLILEKQNTQSFLKSQILRDEQNSEHLHRLQESIQSQDLCARSMSDLKMDVVQLEARRDKLREKAALSRFGMYMTRTGVKKLPVVTCSFGLKQRHLVGESFDFLSGGDVMGGRGREKGREEGRDAESKGVEVEADDDYDEGLYDYQYSDNEIEMSDDSGDDLGVYTHTHEGDSHCSYSDNNTNIDIDIDMGSSSDYSDVDTVFDMTRSPHSKEDLKVEVEVEVEVGDDRDFRDIDTVFHYNVQ